MTEAALDMRSTLLTARRRWKAVAALVGVGIALGVLLTLVATPTYVSRSLVLLPTAPVDAQGKSVRSIGTQALVASSAGVLTQVGQRFSPPVSPAALQKRIDTIGLSDDVVEITAEAGTAPDAKLLADAVAEEYVAVSNTASTEQADAAISVLQAHATYLQGRVQQLEGEIATGTARLAASDPRSTDGVRQGALLDSMRFEQVDASRQLATVNTRIADARLMADLNNRGTRVLQPGEMPTGKTSPRPVFDIGGGALIGLAAAAILVFVLDRNDGRARRRVDVAEALGAPVLASLATPRRTGAARYRDVLERWQPNAVESLALRSAFERLEIGDPDSPVDLVVLTLPGDRVAPMAAARVAAFAATAGTGTALIVASADQSVAELRTACGMSDDEHVRPRLAAYDLVVGVDADNIAEADLTIQVVVARPGRLRIPVSDRPTVTTLALSSGFASADRLAATALECVDADHPLQGVFLVNADPSDGSSGHVEPVARSERPAARTWTNVRDLPAMHPRDLGREAAP